MTTSRVFLAVFGAVLLLRAEALGAVAPGPGEKCEIMGYPGPGNYTVPPACMSANGTAYMCFCPNADPRLPDLGCTGTCVPRQCSPCPKATVECLISKGPCPDEYTCDCDGKNACEGVCKATKPKPPISSPPPPKPSRSPPEAKELGPGENCTVPGFILGVPYPTCKSVGGVAYTCQCGGFHNPDIGCMGTCAPKQCSPCPNATVQCLISWGDCPKGFECDCGGKNDCQGLCKVPKAKPPTRSPPPPKPTHSPPPPKPTRSPPPPKPTRSPPPPKPTRSPPPPKPTRSPPPPKPTRSPPPPKPTRSPPPPKELGPGESCTIPGFILGASWPKCKTVGGIAYVCQCADFHLPDVGCTGKCAPKQCSPCPNATVECLISWGDCPEGFDCDCDGKNGCQGLCKASKPKPPTRSSPPPNVKPATRSPPPLTRPGPGEECIVAGLSDPNPPPSCEFVGQTAYDCHCNGTYNPDKGCTGTCIQKCSPCPGSTLQCFVSWGPCPEGFSCDCGGKKDCDGVCLPLPCCPPVIRKDDPPCRDCGLRGL